MRARFLVLGADGQQGVIASKFLLQKYPDERIIFADIYSSHIRRVVQKAAGAAAFAYCDHRHLEQIRTLIRTTHPDVVLNCANDLYHDNVYDAVLAERVHLVDLGSGAASTTRKRLRRNKEFENAGITAVTGAGSVPGIGNVMFRKLHNEVVGVKAVRTGFAWNSNKKTFVSPFFLYGVLEEMSSPADVVRSGKAYKVPARSMTMSRLFRGVGRQKLYAVSHAEVTTFHHYFPKIKDITFFAGFPDHSRTVVDALIAMGLNNNNPVVVQMPYGETVTVTASDFLTPLVKKMSQPSGYTERENLWVEVDHSIGTVRMECVIPPIPGWESDGCNIDTAFPACIVSGMISEGLITARGLYSPEVNIDPGIFIGRLKNEGFQFYTSKVR